MRSPYSLSFLLMAFAASAGAQETAATVAVPLLGFVYDKNTATVRALTGVPGAAIAEPAVTLDLPDAEFAANGGTLVVIGSTRDDLRIVRPGWPSPDVVRAAGSLRSADRIVVSRATRSAVLIDTRNSAIQVVTGLQGSPVAGPPVSVASPDGADTWKVAVSDDGSRVAIGGEGLVRVITADGSSTVVPVEGAADAVAFAPSSAELIVLLSSGQLLRVHEGSTEPAGHVSGGASLYAAGMQLSSDGRRALIVYKSGKLAAVDIGAAGTLVDCHCSPAGLFSLAKPDLFRLNDGSESPLLYVDISTGAPRVGFIPVARTGEEQ